jgi:hypothetical protein
MKAKFLWIAVIVLTLLSLPTLALAQGPVVSTEPSGDGVEGAPLGSPDALWDQSTNNTIGIASQYFTDWDQGAYSADDFRNAVPWNIELIFVDGTNRFSGLGQLTQADNLHWLIYPDAGGMPAGDPDVGGELWIYSCKPSDPEVTFSGVDNTQVALDILMAQGAPIHLPPGTYWLCFYPSLNFGLYDQWYWDAAETTNLAPAHIIDRYWIFAVGPVWTPWPVVVDPSLHDAAFRLEGTAGEPSNVKYLHCTVGLFNLTDPIGTQWHELWPIFCREYHLSSWNDTSGDGVLSRCDRIDMYEKPDGELRPYHVENVTITLRVKNIETDDPSMYIELEGGYNPTVLQAPECTYWHEIYPNFCTRYHLSGWPDDTEKRGELDFCDNILLTNEDTGIGYLYHVEEVAIDIIVTPEPPPVGGEAYPVNRASLLAPWIALGVVVVVGAAVFVLRRRRA